MRNAKYFLLAAGLIVVLSIFVTGCGNKSVATVNGEKITKEEFYSRLERYQFPIPGQQGAMTPQAGPLCLNDLITEKLVAQIAKDKEVTPTEEQIKDKIELLKKENKMQEFVAQGLTEDDIKKQLWNRQAYINIVSKGEKAEDKEAKAFYDAMKDAIYHRPEQVQIGVIATKDKKAMDKVNELLKSGQEFSTVALKLSDDPTKQNGGVAGWVGRNDEVVPEIVRKSAWDLKKGQVCQPFQIKGDQSKRWYIIKTIDKRPARTQSYASVKKTIIEEIRFRKGMEKVDFPKMLQSYRKKANIEVSDKKYSKLAKSDDKEKAEK